MARSPYVFIRKACAPAVGALIGCSIYLQFDISANVLEIRAIQISV
jgi:hypothetical protein